MNFSWPDRAAGKTARRSAARVGLIGIASLTVVGAAALAAPAMSAMAATLNPTTTVINIPFPDTLPAETAATVPVTVTDDTAGGPAPTGTVTVTTAGAYNVSLPAGEVYSCTTPTTGAGALTPAAGLNTDGLAYSTGTCTINMSNTGVGLGTGFIEIVANYSGDDNNATSNTDGTENKIVNLLPTNTTITPDTATAGKAVTLVATVGPGNILYGAGSDQIFNGTPDVVTFTVNGTAACTNVPLGGPVGPNDPPNYADCSVTLAAGTYAVAANYGGDEYTTPSTGTETLTVAPAAAATTTTMSGVSGYVGSKIMLAAKVGGGAAPAGTVKFVQGSTTLCSATLSNGVAKCAHAWSAVNTYSVEAVYEGNAANKASSAVATVKVTKQPTSVKLTASKATKGKAVTLTATVTSLTSATGTVSFSVNGHTYSVKLVNGKATFKYTWKTAGTFKVTATYGGNTTHLSSKGTDSVKVAA
jgi:large repetitive protein